MDKDKQIIFSGIQATSVLTIGNYIGAVKNWNELQDKYNCLYCIVDMHSITVRVDPSVLRKNSVSALALLIAVGLDPEKNILYFQSHVPQHAELAWVLGCISYMGELSRMTQFKEKSQKSGANIAAGLFNYPILMAADILLFNADLVPVGEDQRQHIELARDLAGRFNSIYGETFRIPQGYTGKTGSRIMALLEPEKKMSKSDENTNNTIYLLDDPAAAANKIKRAVTDSGSEVRYAEDKPGISNLLQIYASLTNRTIAECENEFSGQNYGVFKKRVSECVAEEIGRIRKRYDEIIGDKAYLEGVIKRNAEAASQMAAPMLRKVYREVGFPDRIK